MTAVLQNWPATHGAYLDFCNSTPIPLNYLYTENTSSDEFIAKAGKVFGERGRMEAQQLALDLSELFASGELSDEDFRAEDDVLAVELLTHGCGVAHRNGGLNDHDGVRVIFHDQLDHSFNCRCVKMLGVAIVVSALKFVRRSCSTVAYKAHLLPYVATYPLFRA